MSTATGTARTGEVMREYTDGPDLVMSCSCGRPMRPAEMRRVPTGLGNAAIVRIGCPTCYWEAVGPWGGSS